MYATRHIDWLSITVGSVQDVRALIPSAEWVFTGPGRHGYQSAYTDAITGASFQTDATVSGMDTHLTLSGSTLSLVRSQFHDGDNGLVAACARAGARVSRVDLAANIHEGKLVVRDFYAAYKSGELKTSFRRAYYVEGIGNDRAGDTLYLGSPKSDRQIRIYNKAAELGVVDGVAWLRLELALRDARAKSAVSSMRDNLVSPTISAHLASCITWKNTELDVALEGGDRPVAPVPRKETSTERWLRDQCAPALAKVVAVRPDFMVEFMASFEQSLDKLSTGD